MVSIIKVYYSREIKFKVNKSALTTNKRRDKISITNICFFLYIFIYKISNAIEQFRFKRANIFLHNLLNHYSLKQKKKNNNEQHLCTWLQCEIK